MQSSKKIYNSNNDNKSLPKVSKLGSKIPPNSQASEVAILGAMMISEKAVMSAIDQLEPVDFYTIAHKNIFKAMKDLYFKNIKCDLISVCQQLSQDGNLESVGGEFYIAEINMKTVSASNVDNTILIVLEKSMKRKLIKIAGELLENAYDETVDILEEVDRAEADIFKIAEKRYRNNFNTPSQVVENFNEDLIKKLNGDYKFINFLIPKLQNITGGAHGGDLIAIAGRTSMGKTQFAHALIKDMAFTQKRPVGLFSLEMMESQNYIRQIQIHTGISPEKLRTGKHLTNDELNEIKDFGHIYKASQLYIETKPRMSTNNFITSARRMKKEFGVEAIFLDHLGLMEYSGKNENRTQEVGKTIGVVKSIALELDIPVFALLQLNRSLESQADKRPNLSYLRDSGKLEEDIDMALMLYRPKYYGIENYNYNNQEISADGITEIIVAKNRQGSKTGTIVTIADEFTRYLTELSLNSSKYYFDDTPNEKNTQYWDN